MTGSPGESDPDGIAVRRASRIVGLQITIASGALVLLILGAAFLFISKQQTSVELAETPNPGEHKIYLDSTEAMLALVIIGIIAVLISGILALIFTRRAVNPLGRALRMQRNFVQDASHELRTPLAVLDARLQVLERSVSREDPVTPTVAQLREDARALIDVVNDLLLAAESARAASSSPSAVAPSVLAAADAMRVVAAEHDVGIDVEIGSPAAATTVPPVSLQRCITAFLDNAVSYAPENTLIRVAVLRHRGDVIVTVADEGPGIRGIDPDRIFDRFAHSDVSGRAGRTSFGIGLSLVQDIAIRHGGSAGIVTTSATGTTLALTLPAVELHENPS